MDTSDGVRLLVLLILLYLSAFFSSAETGLTAVNKVRIKTLVADGDKDAILVERLLANQSRLLNSLLIGNNIVNISMTALTTVMAEDIFGSRFVGLVVGVLTLIIIIFGEITPKNYAAALSEETALSRAKAVYLWVKIVTPLCVVFDFFVSCLMRLRGLDPNTKDTYTENEIRTIVDESHEEGEIETEEKEMINNVFDLSETTVRTVMIPRVDVVFLDVNSSYDDVISVYRENMYTRMPVYDGDTDNIIGQMNIKDMVLVDDRSGFDLREILREPFFVYEWKNSSELMHEMLEKALTMAIVLDEYGDTSGIVTMEDLLEEIVGDIRDEYDRDEKKEKVLPLSSGEYIVDGSARLEDLKDLIPGFSIESEEYDSIGGVIAGKLARLPEAGDEVLTDDGYRLIVDEVDGTHIEKVRVQVSDETGSSAISSVL